MKPSRRMAGWHDMPYIISDLFFKFVVKLDAIQRAFLFTKVPGKWFLGVLLENQKVFRPIVWRKIPGIGILDHNSSMLTPPAEPMPDDLVLE